MPFSVSQATAGSPKEIDEVTPATTTNPKNEAPNTSTTEIPPSSTGITAKARGKVTTSKPGPSLASRPLVNTTGKIAMPDNKEVITSREATISTVDAIDIGMSLPVFFTLKCLGI